MFDLFWANTATNVLFLTSTVERTTLYTYYSYSNETCGSPQTVTYNYYWHHREADKEVEEGNSTPIGFQFDLPLFPLKCNNLFYCPVNVATFQIPPFMILKQLDNGSTYFDGIEGIVVRVLSQRLRFTPILVLPDDEERWGSCNSQKTNCTGSLKLVNTFNIAMSICFFYHNFYYSFDFFSCSAAEPTLPLACTAPTRTVAMMVYKIRWPISWRRWFLECHAAVPWPT